MRFTIEQTLSGVPAAVQSVLLDPAFVQARAVLPKLGDPELLDSTSDGTRAEQRIRYRFVAELSSAVTAVIDPEKITWVDDATYDLVGLTAEHRILPDNYADRLRCTYRATLTAEGAAARRTLEGDLKVRMPLVGGRVERAIVDGLRDYAVAEAGLLDEWLTRASA